MDLTLGDVMNAGVNVVTVYLLLRVMNRLDAVTDRIISWLEEDEREKWRARVYSTEDRK